MSYFDPSIFWEGWKATQNFNQTMFNFLDTVWKNQKTKSSENLMGEFVQECISYVSYNTAIANKLFTSLPSVRSHEDLLKLQEQIIVEYSEKNIEILKKLLTMYHQLMQDGYAYSKQQAKDFTTKCQDASKGIMENIHNQVDKMHGQKCCDKNQSKPHNNHHHHDKRSNN